MGQIKCFACMIPQAALTITSAVAVTVLRDHTARDD